MKWKSNATTNTTTTITDQAYWRSIFPHAHSRKSMKTDDHTLDFGNCFAA
jgi:hypothetical protein